MVSGPTRLLFVCLTVLPRIAFSQQTNNFSAKDFDLPKLLASYDELSADLRSHTLVKAWVDKSGKFKERAKYLDFDEQTKSVKLAKLWFDDEGTVRSKELHVPFAQLSFRSQERVNEIRAIQKELAKLDGIFSNYKSRFGNSFSEFSHAELVAIEELAAYDARFFQKFHIPYSFDDKCRDLAGVFLERRKATGVNHFSPEMLREFTEICKLTLAANRPIKYLDQQQSYVFIGNNFRRDAVIDQITVETIAVEPNGDIKRADRTVKYSELMLGVRKQVEDCESSANKATTLMFEFFLQYPGKLEGADVRLVNKDIQDNAKEWIIKQPLGVQANYTMALAQIVVAGACIQLDDREGLQKTMQTAVTNAPYIDALLSHTRIGDFRIKLSDGEYHKAGELWKRAMKMRLGFE